MKNNIMPNFSEWTIDQLVSYCKRLDNDNGDWDNVREDEREYLIDTAINSYIENQF